MERKSWNAWGGEPEPNPAPKEGTLSLLWLKLRRLAPTRPTAAEEHEGQIRYDRDGDVNGVAYIAQYLAGGTYQWGQVALTQSPTFTGTTSSTGNTVIGDATSDLLTITGRIKSAGTSPTITAGAALGGSPTTCTLSGTDRCGVITLDASGATSTGVLATIDFVTAKPDTNYVVLLLPREADALLAIGGVRASATSAGQWSMVADVAISGLQHIWNYLVEEFEP